MPDIKPGRKSLPLVSDLVSAVRGVKETAPWGCASPCPQPCQRGASHAARGAPGPPCSGELGSPYPRVLLFNGAPVPTASISLRFPRAVSGFPFFTGAVSLVPSCPSCRAKLSLQLGPHWCWTDRQTLVPGWQWLFQAAQTLCSCPQLSHVWGWRPPMYGPPMMRSRPVPGLNCTGSLCWSPPTPDDKRQQFWKQRHLCPPELGALPLLPTLFTPCQLHCVPSLGYHPPVPNLSPHISPIPLLSPTWCPTPALLGSC